MCPCAVSSSSSAALYSSSPLLPLLGRGNPYRSPAPALPHLRSIVPERLILLASTLHRRGSSGPLPLRQPHFPPTPVRVRSTYGVTAASIRAMAADWLLMVPFKSSISLTSGDGPSGSAVHAREDLFEHRVSAPRRSSTSASSPAVCASMASRRLLISKLCQVVIHHHDFGSLDVVF